MNLQTGAFGNPQEVDTLILFWSMMANQQYPFAAEIKEQLEARKRMQTESGQMAKMGRL
jgi:hypothetical protein